MSEALNFSISPIFTDREFALTTGDVAQARTEVDDIRALVERTLDDPDGNRESLGFVRRDGDSWRKVAEFYDGKDDGIVLGIARTIFERGVTLEASGAPVEDVVHGAYSEAPEAALLYRLLRKTPWGDDLHQAKLILDFFQHARQDMGIEGIKVAYS